MSIKISSDLAEYFRLNVIFDPEAGATVQTIKISDAARGLRQIRTKKFWRRVKEIGRGGLTAVWLETTNDGLEQRVVKEIRKDIGTTSAQIDYNRELEALALLSNHEEVFAKFYGWYENEAYVYFAMEFFMHGDLGKYIEERLSENETRLIAKQLLDGLIILHDQNWAHRDLKPQNIFVVHTSPNWWIKIGDFGISKRVRDDETSFQTAIWTANYVAPEINDDDVEEDRYTIAVDLWSLGCVLYQLLILKLPFSSRKRRKAYYRSKEHFPIELLEDSKVSADGIRLIKGLMAPLPSDRLTARVASQVPWISCAEETLAFDQQIVLLSRKENPISSSEAKYSSLASAAPTEEDPFKTRSISPLVYPKVRPPNDNPSTSSHRSFSKETVAIPLPPLSPKIEYSNDFSSTSTCQSSGEKHFNTKSSPSDRDKKFATEVGDRRASPHPPTPMLEKGSTKLLSSGNWPQLRRTPPSEEKSPAVGRKRENVEKDIQDKALYQRQQPWSPGNLINGTQSTANHEVDQSINTIERERRPYKSHVRKANHRRESVSEVDRRKEDAGQDVEDKASYPRERPQRNPAKETKSISNHKADRPVIIQNQERRPYKSNPRSLSPFEESVSEARREEDAQQSINDRDICFYQQSQAPRYIEVAYSPRAKPSEIQDFPPERRAPLYTEVPYSPRTKSYEIQDFVPERRNNPRAPLYRDVTSSPKTKSFKAL